MGGKDYIEKEDLSLNLESSTYPMFWSDKSPSFSTGGTYRDDDAAAPPSFPM